MAEQPAKKSGRGGKRPGAGRKPKGAPPLAGVESPSGVADKEKRGRGRPKGSKTKPKDAAAGAGARVAENSAGNSSEIKQGASINDPYALGDAARAHAGTAIATLVHICEQGQSDASRVAAASKLIELGFGKALGLGAGPMFPPPQHGQGSEPEPEKPPEEPIGKKEAANRRAAHPDTTTPMGELLARRLKVVQGGADS